jgi:hypothetical protein
MSPLQITSTRGGVVTSWVLVILAWVAIIALASLYGNIAPS